MSTQPTGSKTLICPVGPGYGTIDPTIVDTLEAGDHPIIEVSPHVFAQWYQNAKRIRFESVFDAVDTEDPEGDVHTLTTLYATQWSHRGAFGPNPVENTGSHPFPLNYIDFDGRLRNSGSSYLDDPNRVYYYQENDHVASPPLDWILYVRFGVFYIAIFSTIYGGEVIASSANADSISITQRLIDGTYSETLVRTATINQRFYP